MMEKLRSLDLHYADVEARLGAPETYVDPALVARDSLLREFIGGGSYH